MYTYIYIYTYICMTTSILATASWPTTHKSETSRNKKVEDSEKLPPSPKTSKNCRKAPTAENPRGYWQRSEGRWRRRRHWAEPVPRDCQRLEELAGS